MMAPGAAGANSSCASSSRAVLRWRRSSRAITSHPPLRVPGTAVFLTANLDAVPHALLHNLKHNKVLHERNVLLTVEVLETPTAEHGERTAITALGNDFYKLTLRFGFAEDPDIPDAVCIDPRPSGLAFDLMDTTFFFSRETIVATDRPGMALWRDKLFVFMQRNASRRRRSSRFPAIG